MSEVTAKMIQELRARTGVGMSKCKAALVRAEGSIEKAIELLRKEGMASSVKKEGRETKDGFIGFFETDDVISLVEINSETDFVAKNERFRIFLEDIVKQAATDRISSRENLLKAPFLKDSSLTVDDERNLLIQKFGENINIRRIELIEKRKGSSYGIYSHMNGKIVSVVEIGGADDEGELAKEVAMHVAAEAPEYLREEDIPKEVLEKEREIALSQVKGKPENIIERIVEGKIKAFSQSVSLVNQKYVKDNTQSVEQFVSSHGAKVSKGLSVSGFWYWKVGS